MKSFCKWCNGNEFEVINGKIFVENSVLLHRAYFMIKCKKCGAIYKVYGEFKPTEERAQISAHDCLSSLMVK